MLREEIKTSLDCEHSWVNTIKAGLSDQCALCVLCPVRFNLPVCIFSPVLSSALSSIATKWDLPILTLPFNILIGVHIAATGAKHCYFPVVGYSLAITMLL